MKNYEWKLGFIILFAVIAINAYPDKMEKIFGSATANIGSATIVSTGEKIPVHKNPDFKNGDHALATCHVIDGKADSVWELKFPEGKTFADCDVTTNEQTNPFDSTCTSYTLWERVVKVSY